MENGKWLSLRGASSQPVLSLVEGARVTWQSHARHSEDSLKIVIANPMIVPFLILPLPAVGEGRGEGEGFSPSEAIPGFVA